MSIIWLALTSIKGIGNKKIISLYRKYPNLDIEQLTNKTFSEKLNYDIKNKDILFNLTDLDILKNHIYKAEKIVDKHKKEGIEVVTIGDSRYPKMLRIIDDPPIVLYCKGNVELLNMSKNIAIVGTREPTDLGVKAAKKIANVFVSMGYNIISGLAEGIDSAGHIGALEANGATIAVMAGSLDKIYPKSNINLATEILQRKGLLISEMPLGSTLFRAAFVQRDRIQSGLSLGVCPVQTDVIGGTQHTIEFAKKQERILFCPKPLEPYEIKATRGIYELIKNNVANVISSPKDYEKINNILIELLEKIYKSEKTIQSKNQISELYQPNFFTDNSSALNKELDTLIGKLINVTKDLGLSKSQITRKIADAYDDKNR